MRIAIIGAGAMGAMFGARFARAGAEVILYNVDASHVGAIAADGLALGTPDGDLQMRLSATTSAAEIGDFDMAVVMVDSNATTAAAKTLASVLPPEAFVVTFQTASATSRR